MDDSARSSLVDKIKKVIEYVAGLLPCRNAIKDLFK